MKLALQHAKLVCIRQFRRIPGTLEGKHDVFQNAAARSHEDHPVAQHQGFGEIVRDKDDAASPALPQIQKLTASGSRDDCPNSRYVPFAVIATIEISAR